MIVIVGAGHAGVQAAAALRQEGYAGRVVLVSAEPDLPYHRPPLSKVLLKDPVRGHQPLRAEAFYESGNIELMLGRSVARIDRAAMHVVLDDGSALPYERLILATGARARMPVVEGVELQGVATLRTLADGRTIGALLAGSGGRAAIVGGGFIGLETAATLAGIGISSTVVEMADRLMGRAVSPVVSQHARDRAEAMSITLATGTSVAAIEGSGGRATGLVTSDGTRIPAGLVLIGIGVDPDTALAGDAGLDVSDGVMVDGNLLTSDPAIFAIGDCARFRHAPSGRSVRLESVQNASDQARHVARVIMGHGGDYDAVPWFWSDQGDMKLQMAGLGFDVDGEIVSGDPADGAFSVYRMAGERLVAVDSVNRPADHMTARRLIGAGVAPTADEMRAGGKTLAAALARLTGQPEPRSRRSG